MDEEALNLYRRYTGRNDPPTEPAREAWVLAGRRGGKSLTAALIAVFLGAFRDYSAVLSPLGGVKLRGFDRATAAWQN